MRASDHPWFGTGFVAMAHRGGPLLPANRGQENTLAAFRRAWDLGYRHLETDVHLTRDGSLVAFHDDRLDRVTSAHGRLADLTLDELRAADVGGEPIPTMAELLEALPQARFNIDLKADGTEAPLVALLERHGASERVCVGSFSDKRLSRFRRLAGPGVATSCGRRATLWMARRTGLNRLVGVRGLAFQVPIAHPVAGRQLRIVTPDFVRRAHRAGKQVHVWTINDEATMERLLDWGVDGIVTDDLELLKSVLHRRGLWT